MKNPRIIGVVFDLDETLVAPCLDYHGIRESLSIPAKELILEHTKKLSADKQSAAFEVIEKFELEAARKSSLNPGVDELIKYLVRSNIKIGIFTRNCLAATKIVIEKHHLPISTLKTRECTLAKPNPKGLFEILNSWNCTNKEMLYVGDSMMDLETGKNAEVPTAIYDPLEKLNLHASFNFKHFLDLKEYLIKIENR